MFSCIVVPLGTCLAIQRCLTKLGKRSLSINFSCPLNKASLIEQLDRESACDNKSFSRLMMQLIEEHCNKNEQINYENKSAFWLHVMENVEINLMDADLEKCSIERLARIQSKLRTADNKIRDITLKKRRPYADKKPIAKGIVLS